MIDFYVGLWSCVIEETAIDGFPALLFYGIPALIVSIPIIIVLLIVGFALIGVIGVVFDDIKSKKEQEKLKRMTDEERKAYMLQKEKERKEAKQRAYERELNDLRFKAQLAELNRQRHRCPLCNYADPDNEFLTLDGKPTGKHRCRNCGHHW